MSDSVKAIYDNLKSFARDLEREVNAPVVPNLKWENKIPHYHALAKATWVLKMDDMDQVVGD